MTTREERERARLDQLMHRAHLMSRSPAAWEDEIRNTVHVEPERRTIHYCQGVEFNNAQFREYFHVADYIPMYCATERSAIRGLARSQHRHTPLPVARVDDTTYRYLSDAQSVNYTIVVHNDKTELAQALADDGAFVIYQGHARYGRGPCSGPDPYGYVGEDWQDGESPTTRGIFKMGFEFIGIPAYEINEHGYRAHLLPASEPLPTPSQCDASLRRVLLRQTATTGTGAARMIAPMRLSEIQTRLVRYHRDHGRDLGALVHGATPDTEVWTYVADFEGQSLRHVIHRAGAANLSATNVRCRAFAHLGCSTAGLNQPVWVGGHAEANDHNISLWTTRAAPMHGGLYLLYYLLAYPNRSAGQPWGDWIDWAVARANADFLLDRFGFQIARGSSISAPP
ncbi:MAG: hypothetical protein U0271_00300 [Polyangiaceae bacterium]